jgi:hypothetical protein
MYLELRLSTLPWVGHMLLESIVKRLVLKNGVTWREATRAHMWTRLRRRMST